VKPSEQCKQYGLNLKQLSEALGEAKTGHPIVSKQTLINWHRNKPELFKAVLIGVVVILAYEGKSHLYKDLKCYLENVL
jgi:hypothetical protein